MKLFFIGEKFYIFNMLELLEEKGILFWFGRLVMDKLYIMYVLWNYCNFF